MYRLPNLSSATLRGDLNRAAVAAPSSPLEPNAPVPATVVISPAVSTLRMRRFSLSAMYRLPDLSSATLLGSYSRATVAAPRSPPKAPVVLLPATVVISLRSGLSGSG